MSTQLFCAMPLPENYRTSDILAFHRRDPQEVAERVADVGLQKGMAWGDSPACLSIAFRPRRAEAVLAIDGAALPGFQPAFEAMVRRMLGLTQGVEAFEARFRHHPVLGALVERQSGLRVPVAATPFEALTWAVAGQQISLSAAVSLRRKMILAANLRHSHGLFCYPDASRVAGLPEESLRQAGFSQTKARTLRTLAALAVENELPFDAWMRTLPVDEVRGRLMAVRGIGPWTVNYALLRGFGWLDGSLHGDAAVRRGLQALLGKPEKVCEKEAQSWLEEFSPWRALVAAHIWAAQASGAS